MFGSKKILEKKMLGKIGFLIFGFTVEKKEENKI